MREMRTIIHPRDRGGGGGGGGRNPIFVSVQVQCSALKFNYVKMKPSAVCEVLPRRFRSFFSFCSGNEKEMSACKLRVECFQRLRFEFSEFFFVR
jgi:hypothetical protein